VVALSANDPTHQPRKLACLTIDMEPDLRDPEQRIRLLDDDRKLRALIDGLRSHDVPLTVFTVMSHARRYVDRLNALADELPVEFAVHSYSHDTNNPASVMEIRQAAEVYGELWNARPLGYRTPNCLIDDAGIDNLIRAGFLYDSSIVPSIRADGYAYNNLRYGRSPFCFQGLSGEILEMPIACFSRTRLPLIFSYVKLLGFSAYRAASLLSDLPDVVVTYFHPYDLYVPQIAHNIPGWKRQAHMRNGSRAYSLLWSVVKLLKERGYSFVLMKTAAAEIDRAALRRHRLAIAA
jgi:hypothetical protein